VSIEEQEQGAEVVETYLDHGNDQEPQVGETFELLHHN
jgi:hypothetical protein